MKPYESWPFFEPRDDPSWYTESKGDKIFRELHVARLQDIAKEEAILNKHKKGDVQYLITFTKRADLDVSKWKQRIEFELKRKFIKSFKLTFEHLDSNAHAHAHIIVNQYLKKNKHFKTYIQNYGFVDLKTVKYDNGIEEYLGKENEIITSF